MVDDVDDHVVDDVDDVDDASSSSDVSVDSTSLLLSSFQLSSSDSVVVVEAVDEDHVVDDVDDHVVDDVDSVDDVELDTDVGVEGVV